ncbi:MAG: hypothetical protein JWP52_623 [Rhizobacter sp.]|jgi:hypothetical protein|nr:hypothetical protein [Rhizobacter sp.]
MKRLVIWAVGVPLIVASMVVFSFQVTGAQDVALATSHTVQ